MPTWYEGHHTRLRLRLSVHLHLQPSPNALRIQSGLHYHQLFFPFLFSFFLLSIHHPSTNFFTIHHFFVRACSVYPVPSVSETPVVSIPPPPLIPLDLASASRIESTYPAHFLSLRSLYRTAFLSHHIPFSLRPLDWLQSAASYTLLPLSEPGLP